MAEESANGRLLDAVVIGAGFAGLAMANRLKEAGFSFQGFETGADVGGTWYWNRYPGARCDVPSMEYSYRFSDELQQEWDWSERYAPQPEILDYVRHVADRFDLRSAFRFETSVVRADWDEAASCWLVATSDGATTRARFLISAVGCLSATNVPDIPGLDDFKGRLIHTGRWPHEGVDLGGQRVGVIGTGSSGVQAIPRIAEQAGHLTVFQRTATYCVPSPNGPLPKEEADAVKADYGAFREQCGRNFGAISFPVTMIGTFDVDEEERRRRFEAAWTAGSWGFSGVFYDITFNMAANDEVGRFFEAKIRELVPDPAVADKLTPRHRFGEKRLCIGSGFYEAFNRPNVTLVSLRDEPLERVVAEGVKTSAGTYPLDTLVLATGYDAITGPLMRIAITGRDGRTMQEAWGEGAVSYLGLSVAGFPNMFIVSGPGSPCVLTNMVYSIEQHVDWIAGCMSDMRAKGETVIEADEGAQEAWGAELDAMSAGTLYATGNSWYNGANIEGKARRFMVHLDYPNYVKRCETVRDEGYAGFVTGGSAG